MIYERYDYSMFERRFRDYGRLGQFPKGLRALFDYFESLSEDIGEDIKIDVIALCCEYTESTISEALKCYDLKSIEELRYETTVIDVDDDTIIYANY